MAEDESTIRNLGLEILKTNKLEPYKNPIANEAAGAFIRKFEGKLPIPVQSEIFVEFEATPITSSIVGEMANNSVTVDSRTKDQNLYLEGFTGDAEQRAAMSVLFTGKLENGTKVPVGIENFAYMPPADPQLQEWHTIFANRQGDQYKQTYANLVPKDNGLIIKGWTYLSRDTDNLAAMGFPIPEGAPNEKIRASHGLGNALTEATASLLNAIRNKGIYPANTTVMIERMGVLGSVMSGVKDGQTDFSLGAVLGFNSKEDIQLQIDRLSYDPSQLGDWAARLQARQRKILEVYAVDIEAMNSDLLNLVVNITPLIGVGHPSSFRAGKISERLGLQQIPNVGHHWTGGPLFIGKLSGLAA